MHAEGASLRSAPRTPAWWPGPARVAPSPPGPPPGEPDASLSCVAPGTQPGARRGRAARPSCAGSAARPHAPTPRAPSCRRPTRSSAGPGRTRCTAGTAAGTPADRTPPTAATPRAASHARRLLAPRPGVRYPSLTGPPLSHTRARLQEGPPGAAGGPSVFQDARDRGLHRCTPHPSTFWLHTPAVSATNSGNSGRPMTRNQRFVETINRWGWAASATSSRR